MIDLVPVQYRMAALAALFVISVSAAFGAGWTVNGWRLGKEVAEDRLSDATSAVATLVDRINGAQVRGAELETGLAKLGAAAAAAKKEISNVLPPRESDRLCDLPAAARSLLNRASGYPD